MQKQALLDKFNSDVIAKSNLLRTLHGKGVDEAGLSKWFIKCIGEFTEWELEYDDAILLIISVMTASGVFNSVFTIESAFDLLQDVTTRHRTDEYNSEETAKDIIKVFNQEVDKVYKDSILLERLFKDEKSRCAIIDFIYDRMPRSMQEGSKVRAVAEYVKSLSQSK